jgi:hypothetical protein
MVALGRVARRDNLRSICATHGISSSILPSRHGSACSIAWRRWRRRPVDRAIREEGERLRRAFPFLDERKPRRASQR